MIRAFNIFSIRPLTTSDLKYIGVPKGRRMVAKIRDSHHNIARLTAMGLTPAEVASRTGYSIVRVRMLMNDPSMQELVSNYRGKVDEAYITGLDNYREMIMANAMKAERQIGDKLDAVDDSDETLPIRDLVAISRDGADRLGYGKRSTNVNLNLDFASKLESAIARSNKVLNVEQPTEYPEPTLRRRA